MNKINFSGILRNILTFLVIFLLVQLGYNYFFNQPQSDSEPTGISFTTDQRNYALNDNVTATLTNNTTEDISFAYPCPTPAAQVSRFQNGTWNQQNLQFDQLNEFTQFDIQQATDCPEDQQINLSPGESYQFDFSGWISTAFPETGSYKLTLETAQQTLETNQFEINNQSFFAWLWTTLLYQPFYNALIFFSVYTPWKDLGIAIIILTILIRTILLYPNHRALKAQARMQQIQPKIAALQDKHKGNKEKIAMETLAIYKSEKVNPVGSCLPILIQLPILFALFHVIQTGLNINNKHLLYGYLQFTDITQINTNFLGILELTEPNFIWLPIVVGGLQYFQMNLAMAKRKQAGNQQKPKNELEIATRSMTTIMPLMIAVFTASVPAGVGLYWAFSTIYGIFQQLFINNQIKDKSTEIRVIEPKKSNKEKKQSYKSKNQNNSTSETDTASDQS